MTTLRDVLFGEVISGPTGTVARKVEEASERLAKVGSIPRPGEVPAVTFARGVMTKVAGLLNVKVSDVMVEAWRVRSALLKAAHETVANPGTYKQVTVKNYAFPWDHELDVDVTWNSSTIATVTFVVGVTVEVTAVSAVVHNGHLTSINGGKGVVRVVLRVKSSKTGAVSVPVAKGDRQFDLSYEMQLAGEGIPLVREIPKAQGAASPA